uniref:methyltransferase domain-containing protein n=1 Tax=Castellaniella defragrans TaxID=75697 RepID=UPI0033419F9F
MDRKQKIISGLDIVNSVGAEIGPLHRPIVSKGEGNILYVDHEDTKSLREKYKNDPDVDADAIVGVDGVWGKNTLSNALNGRTVDYVIASHVVEHVPDLITWLSEVRCILNTGGQLRLVVPDRRFTFDILRSETTLSEVFLGYLTKSRVPHPYLILDFFLKVRDVDCGGVWAGRVDAENLGRKYSFSDALDMARDSLENGVYRDVHCWVFTPESFAKLFLELAHTGMLGFACVDFHDTERDQLEFFVALRSSEDQEEIISSWQAMVNSFKTSSVVNSIWPQDAEREISRLKHQLQQSLAAEASYRKSKSWRITAPLRAIASSLRNFRRN